MKKLISILLVLCVAVTLFAAGSVKVGGAFNFVTGGTKDFDKMYVDGEEYADFEGWDAATYKTYGFGFDVAGSFDVSEKLAVWTDFNMVFGTDAKYKVEGDDEISLDEGYEYFKENYDDAAYKKINMISFGAGVAYKLDLNPAEVKVGAGLFFNRAFGKVGAKDDTVDLYTQFKSVNFGVAILADASYKFNQNIGVGLTLMPQIGLYNSTTITYGIDAPSIPEFDDKVDIKAKGLKLSFAMPVVIGVTYSF